MRHKSIPDNVVEPELIAEWRKLNKEAFDSRIKSEPTALVWHYDIRRYGGYCSYPNKTSEVKIAIKATLKENYQAWRLMLAHEMIHQLLYEIYRDCPEIAEYTRNSFTGDKSSSFMIEVYNVSQKLGVDYRKVQYHHSENEDANLNTKTQSKYYKDKVNAERGKAVKGRLFSNG